jgi:hypothetical protein
VNGVNSVNMIYNNELIRAPPSSRKSSFDQMADHLFQFKPFLNFLNQNGRIMFVKSADSIDHSIDIFINESNLFHWFR